MRLLRRLRGASRSAPRTGAGAPQAPMTPEDVVEEDA
jgi:hypothetical protein